MEKKKFKRIGFIGLGRMGRPIAENLLRKGFLLTIFARKYEVREEMKALGAEVSSSPAELAKRSEIIVLAVTTPDDVGSLLFKDGIDRAASKGTVVIASREGMQDVWRREGSIILMHRCRAVPWERERLNSFFWWEANRRSISSVFLSLMLLGKRPSIWEKPEMAT
jgi:hypothetical protein